MNSYAQSFGSTLMCAVVKERVERKDKKEVGSLVACMCNSSLQNFSSDIKASLKHWHKFL